MSGFWQIHDRLAREGPGDRASLDWALGHAAPPPDARLLDAGCGPGVDIAALLAHAPRGRVLALEKHPPYVARAAALFAGDGRVRAEVGDMLHPEGRFDLIWCAGAIYFAGVRRTLECWRAHLEPGARVAFSQIAWKVARPSPAAKAFWQAEYAQMSDAAGVLEAVAQAGFAVIATRFLPDSAWRQYLVPLAARLEKLRRAAPVPDLAPDLEAALAAEQAEIDLWHAHGPEYGYLQVVCAPRCP